MTTLHITNGDSVAGTLMKIVSAEETVLPWRDVLHDGPVPGGVDAETLRQTRARFLSERGWTSYELTLADIVGRDAQLAAMRAGDHVTLWFEPDLYDQLQLLEILSRLYLRPAAERPSISLVATDELLGALNEKQLAKYLEQQRDVREVDLELAAQGWEAFTSSNANLLNAFAGTESALFKANSYREDSSVVLPHVHGALRRLLEEFPSRENGLSRTEQQIMNTLVHGPKTVGETYQLGHAPNEDLVWLGDWSYAWYVERLMAGPHPLVEFVSDADQSISKGADSKSGVAPNPPGQRADFWTQQVRLTDEGQRVASKKANAITLNGIDRWIGGVHLQQAPQG